MSEIVSKEKWLERWGNASLGAIQAGALEYGHKLKATKKADALDEAYELYAGRLKPSAPVEPPAEPKPLQYEGRCIGEVQRRIRAGYRLTRYFAVLSPIPTEDQLAALRADPYVQVRVAK